MRSYVFMAFATILLAFALSRPALDVAILWILLAMDNAILILRVPAAVMSACRMIFAQVVRTQLDLSTLPMTADFLK
jgi:hypothetical protein